MTGLNLKQILRSLLFLIVSMFILLLGILPGNFSQAGFQISPFLFAWVAAFIIRRPGSVGIIVILLAALQFMIYNDEGVAWGAFAYLIFALLVHELRNYLEHQSFVIEWSAMIALYIFIEFGKNILLQIFFSYHFPVLEILRFSLYFSIGYPCYSGLIYLILGKRSAHQLSTNL